MIPAVLLPVFVAILGGLAIGLQNPLASLMGQRIGILEGVLIIHLGGTIAAAALILAVPGGHLEAWRQVPWYALVAGALGVVVVGAVSFTIPRMGVAATVSVVVGAQLALSAWLDHYGMLGVDVRLFDASRLLGVLLLLGGVWLLLRG